MLKYICECYVVFSCDQSYVERNSNILKKEIEEIGLVTNITLDHTDSGNFGMTFLLVCTNFEDVDRTVINTFKIFNHIVKIINSEFCKFNWLQYDDYNCAYDECKKLKMVYMKNKPNLLGFPIQSISNGFVLRECVYSDTYPESIESMLKKISI